MFGTRLMSSQPKAFWVLSSLEACEAFSFYGVSSLLLLFLSQKLGYHDTRAIGIYAIYMAMKEIFSFVGGVLADRILGLRRCITMGCWLMLCGYLLIPLLPQNWFYLGLGFIVMGGGLFASNSTTLLGLFYDGIKDPRREKGFILYYASLNFGALLSIIFSGIIAERYGWTYGFSFISLGLILAVFILFRYQHILAERDLEIQSTNRTLHFTQFTIAIIPFFFALGIYYYKIFSPIMPFLFLGSLLYLLKEWFHCTEEDRKNIGRILLLVFLLMVFYAVEEQTGSSLMLFASRHVDVCIGEWRVPIAPLQGVNPFVVVILSPFLVFLLKGKSYKESLGKVILGFFLLAISFAYIFYITHNRTQIHVLHFISAFAGISLAELFVGPIIYSLCTTLSPKHLKGAMMGLVTIGYAGANHLGGYLAHTMSVRDFFPEFSMSIYREGFRNIVFILILIACIMFLVQRISCAIMRKGKIS